jgi:hypothetical protein
MPWSVFHTKGGARRKQILELHALCSLLSPSTVPRATARRFLLRAVIPPAPFLSGGRSGAGGGGEPGNQHADVYMFASFFPRVCSPLFLAVWLRVPVVVCIG